MYEMENNGALYYFSKGVEKKAAILYAQQSEGAAIKAIASITGVDMKELEQMKDVGIASNDGRLYVSVVWSGRLAQEKHKAYQNTLAANGKNYNIALIIWSLSFYRPAVWPTATVAKHSLP